MALLKPVRTTRWVEFLPPLAASPDAVLDEIRVELRRNGNRLRSGAPRDRVEFDGPGLFTFSFSRRHQAAGLVRGGTVTVDPAAPDRRIRMELRLSAMVYVWPCIVAAALVLALDTALPRAIMLLVLAGISAFNYGVAVNTCEGWIATAARRARR